MGQGAITIINYSIITVYPDFPGIMGQGAITIINYSIITVYPGFRGIVGLGASGNIVTIVIVLSITRIGI